METMTAFTGENDETGMVSVVRVAVGKGLGQGSIGNGILV